MPRPPLRAWVAACAALATVVAPVATAASSHGGRGADSAVIHGPGYVRDHGRKLGVLDPHSPIHHIVVVMQENHSFDEYFGMLARQGQPKADGFTFNSHGVPINSNPDKNGAPVTVSHHPQICSADNAGQSWNSSHNEIDHGAMDGFARINPHAMHYYDRKDIPFYYSLASKFTLANRWFSSVPAQTYPNRRFLYAGTAYGNISTDTSSYFDKPPPHGTIQDEFHKYHVSWRDYVTDLPDTALITSNIKRYPYDYTSIGQFYADAKAGTLPDVSYLESDGGVPGIAGSGVEQGYDGTGAPKPQALANDFYRLKASGGDEEDDDVRIGEHFVARVVHAVTHGRDWKHTLLICLYDEHGGFYDHVSPPAAIKPDNIPPKLHHGDVQAGYDQYGVRVPAVVVSPYSKPHAVTDVVHDHTSVLAEIEQLWNLPALTYRDANAADLSDFLDLSHPRLLHAPKLAAPGPVELNTCHAT
jgi:phospholipase C